MNETLDDINAIDQDSSVDLLASDFIARYRNGDRPTIDEYAQRHPELRKAIRRVFPLMLSVEKLKVDQQVESDGRVTLAGRSVERLGDFRLLREIGRGGMGIVYEAQQESLGRTVAVKLLPKQSLLDDAALDRFHHEARTAAAMHHSNIVPIFGTGESGGTHYLVMQLVRGMALDTRIASDESLLSFDESASIARQVADALVYAHASGVLHRDIKPANILLDESGTAQITDFGVARNRSDDPTQTQTLSGSPRYMAPERFRGEGDERSDVYGLGLTLYEMLAGEPAFVETDSHQLIDAVLHYRMKPLRAKRHDVPPDLDTIVQKAINAEPSQRYPTAAEFRDDLVRFLANEPIQARRVSPFHRGLRWCRRNPKIAISSGIAIASLAFATLASTTGLVLTSAANERAREALVQSEQMINLALQSLDGVIEMVAVPSTALGNVGFEETEGATLYLAPSPKTAQILERLQPIYERLSQQSPTRPDIVTEMTQAKIRLAQIQRQLGDNLAAIESLRSAITVIKTRSETAGLNQSDKQSLLATLGNELGTAYVANFDFEKADASYLDTINAIQSLTELTDESKLSLARAHVELGDPLPQRRRIEGHLTRDRQNRNEHLNFAHPILERLHRKTPNNSQVEILRARVRLAESRLQKEPIEKQAAFGKGIKILRQQLENASNDVSVRLTLVESLAEVDMRRAVQTSAERIEASNRLQESLGEIQFLRDQFPETPTFAASEIHILHRLSRIAIFDNDYQLARNQIEQAITIQSHLVDGFPQSSIHRCWRALLYRSLAEVCESQSDLTHQREAIANAITDVEKIAPSDQDHPFVLKTRRIIQEIQSRMESKK